MADLYKMVGDCDLPPLRSTTPMPSHSDRDQLFQFGELIAQHAINLARQKNADYSSDVDPLLNLRIGGSHGVAVRITDKACRLVQLTKNGHLPHVQESVEDTCLDLINYAWLLLALRNEESK